MGPGHIKLIKWTHFSVGTSGWVRGHIGLWAHQVSWLRGYISPWAHRAEYVDESVCGHIGLSTWTNGSVGTSGWLRGHVGLWAHQATWIRGHIGLWAHQADYVDTLVCGHIRLIMWTHWSVGTSGWVRGQIGLWAHQADYVDTWVCGHMGLADYVVTSICGHIGLADYVDTSLHGHIGLSTWTHRSVGISGWLCGHIGPWSHRLTPIQTRQGLLISPAASSSSVVRPQWSSWRFCHYGACWVFLRFHYLPNSDMDYEIFNVNTDVNACDCTRACTDTARESALKGWLWE